MTARELCTAALSYLGVIAANETPDAADINVAFDALNDLVDSFSTDEHLLYAETEDSFSLISGQASYTIGATGADFTTVRPGEIQRAYVTVDGVDYPLTSLNNAEYVSIGMKALQITWPQYFYYNPSYPNGTIKFWPVPSAVHTVKLTSLKQFVRFASLNTSIALPVGYARMLRWNLIKEVADAFGKTASASAISKANESKATLQRLNSPPVKMTFDSTISGRRGYGYNIYTDGYK